MDEAVDEGDDASGGGQHVGPFGERFVSGEEDGHGEVPAGDDLEEEVGVAVVVVEVSDFVDGENLGSGEASQSPGNHAAGRALSAAVHAGVPEADGFLFPSRFTGDICVAVFDRAFGKLRVFDLVESVSYTPGMSRARHTIAASGLFASAAVFARNAFGATPHETVITGPSVSAIAAFT